MRVSKDLLRSPRRPDSSAAQTLVFSNVVAAAGRTYKYLLQLLQVDSAAGADPDGRGAGPFGSFGVEAQAVMPAAY